MQLLSGLRPFSSTRIAAEVIAGATLAAIGIPEVMGYSTIAGMPIITGLYTLIVPMAVFALVGSSKHLAVAADSATAAILAAGLVGLAAVATTNYVALAGFVAVCTGGLLVVVRLLRLGFLADFLSRTLLVGFLVGVGMTVAIGQLPEMLGLTVHSSSTPRLAWKVLSDLSHADGDAVLITAVCLVLLVGARLLSKRLPAGLVVVVGSIVASKVWNFGGHGIATVGHLKAGLPTLSMPRIPAGQLTHLVTIAFSLVVVIVAQSAATSRAYAARYDEDLDENQDLVALGLANLAAGLTGTYVVNGSPTKTEIVDGAGSRTQFAALVTAGVALVAIFTLTGPLAYLPKPALATVVFMIGVGLIKLKDLVGIAKLRRDECIVAVCSAAVVVAFGVEIGIFLAVVLCLLNHLRRGYSPENMLMVLEEDGTWQPHPVSSKTQAVPGVYIYRFQAALYYANVAKFAAELTSLTLGNPPRAIIVDCSAIADVDVTAEQELTSLVGRLHAQGIALYLTHLATPVLDQLTHYGVTTLEGLNIEERTHEALAPFRS